MPKIWKCADCGSPFPETGATCEACGGADCIAEAPAVALKKVSAAPLPRAVVTPVTAPPPASPPSYLAGTPVGAVPATITGAGSAGIWATVRGMAFGLLVGWVVRWGVAGVLYLGRAIHDSGLPGRSSWLWIEISSVIIGFMACGLALRSTVSEALGKAASATGLSLAALRARFPWEFGRLPLLSWLIYVALVTAAYSPAWLNEKTMSERHAMVAAEAKRLEFSGRQISPDGENAFDLYSGILRENPNRSEALSGRERIIQLVLANASKRYSERKLPEAEQLYQLLLSKGIDASLIDPQRAKHYQIVRFFVSPDWSPPFRIGDRYLEIVADGPFEVGSEAGNQSQPVTGKGTHELLIDTMIIKFRSPSEQRLLTLYLANWIDTATPESFIKLFNPIGRLTRTAGGKLTITGGASNFTPPPPAPNTQTSSENNSNVKPSPPRSDVVLRAGTVPQVPSGNLLTSYRALISSKDKRNSKGQDLTKIPNIKLQDFLQQDRYNFHNRINRDGKDQGDSIGSNKGYKAMDPFFLNPLTVDTPAECLQSVLDGEPILEVSIYEHAIGVRLIRR